MKLFVTPTSPFARLVMIVRLEKGLENEVELVWTRTRQPDDPLLNINPSGRIPFLQIDEATGFEDTEVIVPYLDALVAPRRFEAPEDWSFRRLQAMARSMLDGVCVWAREILRPEHEQSPTIIAHERRRADRLADYFETSLADASLSGEVNMVQLLLFCALDVERRLPQFDWRSGRPALVEWHAGMLQRPAVAASLPPPGV